MKPLEEEDVWGTPEFAEDDLSFPANDDFTFGSGDLEALQGAAVA